MDPKLEFLHLKKQYFSTNQIVLLKQAQCFVLPWKSENNYDVKMSGSTFARKEHFNTEL